MSMKIRVDVPEWSETDEVWRSIPREGVHVALFVEIFSELTDSTGKVDVGVLDLPKGTPVICKVRSVGTLPYEKVFKNPAYYEIIMVQPDGIADKRYVEYLEKKDWDKKLFAGEWVRKMWKKLFSGGRRG